jgi:hypothetical protein
LGEQFSLLRDEISRQLCKLKQENYLNELKKKPGTLVLERAEIAFVKHCRPVLTSFRQTKKCYLGIPVNYNQKPYFILPITKNLATRATEISCSDSFHPEFLIDNKMYSFTNFLKETVKPAEISFNNFNFEYHHDLNVVENSILSKDQMEDMAKSVSIHLSKNAVNDAIISSHQQVLELDESLIPLRHESHSWFDVRSLMEKFGLGNLIWLVPYVGIGLQGLFGLALFLLVFGSAKNIKKIYKVSGLSCDLLSAYSSNKTYKIVMDYKMRESQERMLALINLNSQNMALHLPSAPIISELNSLQEQSNQLTNLNKYCTSINIPTQGAMSVHPNPKQNTTVYPDLNSKPV